MLRCFSYACHAPLFGVEYFASDDLVSSRRLSKYIFGHHAPQETASSVILTAQQLSNLDPRTTQEAYYRGLTRRLPRYDSADNTYFLPYQDVLRNICIEIRWKAPIDKSCQGLDLPGPLQINPILNGDALVSRAIPVGGRKHLSVKRIHFSHRTHFIADSLGLAASSATANTQHALVVFRIGSSANLSQPAERNCRSTTIS